MKKKKIKVSLRKCLKVVSVKVLEGDKRAVPARGGTLGISGWGCAAGSLEPLTFTRASSAEFCYPILE